MQCTKFFADLRCSSLKFTGFAIAKIDSLRQTVTRNKKEHFYFQLKSLPIEVIIAAAEKCRNRSQSDHKDWITLLWSPEDNAKATKTLLDHAMCVASRKKLENPQIKTIVTAWLNSLNFDPNDSNLDLEVEKYVALDEHSTLSYIIGHRLVQKVRRTSTVTTK